MTSGKSDELDKDIRMQGLLGIALLLVTMVMFVYRTGAGDGKAHNSVAERASVALETAQSDLQGLFDGKAPERDIALLKRRAMFGWDFVTAWLVFILYLQIEIMKCRIATRRALWCAFISVIGTVIVQIALPRFIATAEQQAVTEAELNRILFSGQAKWLFLFLDAALIAVQLYATPAILRVGAVILGASSVVAFAGMVVPSGLPVPYCVLGIFLAFSGICTLLLFHPQLLYEKSPPVGGVTRQAAP